MLPWLNVSIFVVLGDQFNSCFVLQSNNVVPLQFTGEEEKEAIETIEPILEQRYVKLKIQTQGAGGGDGLCAMFECHEGKFHGKLKFSKFHSNMFLYGNDVSLKNYLLRVMYQV